MKNKLLILTILPLLIGMTGCNNSEPINGSENESSSQEQAKEIPYVKLLSSRWILGSGETTQTASQYEVYIDIATENIYYFDGGWNLLCKVGDPNDVLGSQTKIIDGKVFTLKRYQIGEEIIYKWEEVSVIDITKYCAFEQENETLKDISGQSYMGYYSFEKTNKTIMGQGGTIYNGKLYVGSNAGVMQVKDFETNTTLASMTLDKAAELQGGYSVKQPHNNAVGYAPKEGSEYPYIYTNCYSDLNNHLATLCVYSFDYINQNVDEDVELSYTLGASINAGTGKNSADLFPDNKYGHVTTVHTINYSLGLTFKIDTSYVYMIMCYDTSGAYLGTSKNNKNVEWITGEGQAYSLDSLKTTYPTIGTIKIAFKDPTAPWTVEPTSKTPAEAGLIIHRTGTIQGYTNDLVQIIKINFLNDPIWTSSGGASLDRRPYGNFAIDYKNGFLYALALKTGDKVTTTIKFRLPSIDEGTYDNTYDANIVRLEVEDVIDYFDTPYAYSIQDVDFFNNYIFVTEGFTNNASEPARMRVIDVVNQCQVALFEIYLDFFPIEPEFICWYEGELYYSDARLDVLKIKLL